MRRSGLYLTQAELCDRLGMELDISQNRAEVVIQALANVVYEAMTRGEKVNMGNLGTFIPTYCRARDRRDIIRDKFVPCPPTIQIRFRARKEVRLELAKVVARSQKARKRSRLAVSESGYSDPQLEDTTQPEPS